MSTPTPLTPADEPPRLTTADLDNAARAAVENRPQPPAAPNPRSGKVLIAVAIIAASLAVVLSQIVQLRSQSERQAVVTELRQQVDDLSAELGCRSVIATELELATAEADEAILRGLSALAVDDPALLRLIGEQADRIADRIAAASQARASAVETCSARAVIPGATP